MEEKPNIPARSYLDLYTIREAANKIGIEYKSFWQLINQRLIAPPVRDLGGSRRKYYSAEDLAEIQTILKKRCK